MITINTTWIAGASLLFLLGVAVWLFFQTPKKDRYRIRTVKDRRKIEENKKDLVKHQMLGIVGGLIVVLISVFVVRCESINVVQ